MSEYDSDRRVFRSDVDLVEVTTADRGAWYVYRDGYHQWWTTPVDGNPLAESLSIADLAVVQHGPCATADAVIRHLIGDPR